MKISRTGRIALAVVTALAVFPLTSVARAQDVPGIEICTVEKTMERRTSCLQSNINYLHQLMTRNAAETTQKLSVANSEINALKLALAKLQMTVDQLQVASAKQENKK